MEGNYDLGMRVGVEGEESFSAALKRINSNLASQRAQMRAIAKTYDENDQSIERLTKQETLLNRQIDTQMQKLLLLQSRLNQARDEYGESSAETEKWQEKVNAAAAELDRLASELDRNDTALKEAQHATGQLAQEQQQAAEAAEEMRKAEQESTDAIEKSSEKLQRAAESMQAVNRAAMAVAAGAAAVTVAAGKAGIDFEDAFAGVVKTVDATDEQLATLHTGIRDLATQMPTAATEIAGVAEAAGQLGIATDDILSFTETMVMLGDSTNLTAEEAASALAKFANITGTTADNYGRLGATIVDLGNNFATTEADIVEMSTRLASAGTLAGLTEAEIMALATSMSAVGIEAEAGGTAMTQTLAAMESAAAKGGESLRQFAEVAGMSSAEFRKLWNTDTITAVQRFISGLGELEDKGESAVLVLDEMGLSGVRQSNMLQSLALAADTMGDAVDTANKAWDENTALVNEAEKRYETTASKLEMLKNAAVDVGIAFYDRFSEPINEAVGEAAEKVAELADQLESGNLDDTLAAIGSAAAAAAAGIVTMNGVLMVKDLANFASAVKLGGEALEKYTAATKAGAIAQGALNLAQSLSPVGILAAGVAAAVVGLKIYSTVTSDSESETEKFSRKVDELNERIQKSADEQQRLAEAREESVATVETEISKTQSYIDELKRITDENGKVNEGYETRADFLMQQVNSLIPNAISKNEDEAGSIYEISDAIEEQMVAKRKSMLLDAMQDEYANALNTRAEAQIAYTEALMAQGDAQQHLNDLDAQYNELTAARQSLLDGTDLDGVVELSNGLSVTLADVGQELYNVSLQQETWRQKLDETTPAVQAAKEQLDGINQTISNYDAISAADSMEQLEAVVARISSSVVKFTGENRTQVAEAVVATQTAYNQMVAEVAKSWDQMDETQRTRTTSMLAALKSSLDQQVVEAKNGGYEVAASTGEGLAEGSYVYSGALGEMIAEGQAQLEAAGIDAIGQGESYMDNFGEGVQENIDEILGIVSGMTGEASAELERAASSTGTIGENFTLGFSGGMSSQIQSVINAATAVANAAINAARTTIKEGSPSKVMIESGMWFDVGFAKGIDDNADKAEDAASKMSQKVLDAANDWLDDQKFYNRLAIGDEVDFWEQMLTVSELQASEIAEVQKKLYTAREDASKASFENSKKWIETEKYYNRLSAEEELAAWERVVNRKNLLVEEQLEAEKQLYAVQQSIIDEYTSDLDARVQSLSSYAGLFDEVNKDSEVTGEQLLQNLKDQVEVFKDWQADMETLMEKGVTGPLLEELQELGPSAAQEIHALSTLTEDELDEYADLFDEKSRLIQEQAEKELGAIPITLDVQEVDLSQAVDTSGISSIVTVLSTTLATALASTMEENAGSIIGTGSQAVTSISTGMIEAEPELQETAAAITENANDLIASYQSDMQSTGLYLMQGVAQGVLDGKSGVVNAVESALWAAVQAARAAMDINSPSGVMADIGDYMAQGLDAGWTKRMQQVARDINDSIPVPDVESRHAAAERIGESVVNGIAAATMGGAQTVIIPVNLNGKQIAEVVYDPLKQVGKQRGY